ncbi:tRNA (guanosine(37)-N1)-methyltransferase TrmD [Neoehrlichia mikurensis]|uniref:tRNA (guanine-N(1)-)-methyltransferase n=1 Tax=Neoehrlichia mikurensis TaxID=89586 RepID=A0A9Q9C1N9_9RICK|nr:tRNA (guanosine(37)-N1)-methyltransferase TrmD [Neoehrlichia mikurensis]QXK91584.1 tRNA (guanosine(37)-N1)-methyltransferase TrmD [Neoehrlichia mikurensis]QXK92795.1 tRNA (guanosine(37)-N1)-methyltransferase TrmD [Neoehrlichia mikurensis]QXK93274.1 tRNA (guanosine(37)-N1)-methyltransferase TrmD [Neoehrlichia mikurensis]UTO55799.1 tRNA (guanosine(37)-N1)-methyltransferase TrmD [Neoehrlichia mikurensis]UTO56713.1 tRNA (guanosine(37)-N1)-methyltransferase TrmD [Neoehrlichia mikurensis]
MIFNILTIFPQMFPGPLSYSIIGKALKKGIWSLNIIDIRSFAHDKHKTVDDRPYGGGPGMIMKADVVGLAIDHVISKHSNTKLIYMSPSGKTLTQNISRQIVHFTNITILCGRFEGIDKRILDFYNFQEISIGDYILSGGELAAMVLIDSCVRLIAGIIGNTDSLIDESFNNGLEYPQYTRPSTWMGLDVPDVLLSGNHKKIKEWQKKQSYDITKQKRPELVKKSGEIHE